MKDTDCKNQLLQILDNSVTRFEFPTFESDEFNAISGRKRALGYRSQKGVALVFECAEYSHREGCIQTILYCFATFPLLKWVTFGNGIYIPSKLLSHSQSGEFILLQGTFPLAIREKVFIADFPLIDPLVNPYEQLLTSVCKQIPPGWLFSSTDYILNNFGIPSDMPEVMTIDQWSHPTMDEVYINNRQPSSYPDILMMAEAICKRS